MTVEGQTWGDYTANYTHAHEFKEFYDEEYEDYSYLECKIKKYNPNPKDGDKIEKITYELKTYKGRIYRVEYNLAINTTTLYWEGSVRSYCESSWWLDVLGDIEYAVYKKMKMLSVKIQTHFANNNEEFGFDAKSTKEDFIFFKKIF